MCRGETYRTCAAASSIASGIPSSRRHISATSSMRISSTGTIDRTARARWRNNSTAGFRAVEPTSPTGSGSISICCSPRKCRGVRLVTSSLSVGHPTRRSARNGAASTICSRLSSTTSISRSARKRFSECSGERVGLAVRPRLAARVTGTRAGLVSGASETKAMPSAYSRSTRQATSMATRVLPTPPVPVTVTSLNPSWCSRCRIMAISRSRPRIGVGGRGMS